MTNLVAEIETAIPELRRFARGMVRNQSLADDMVQDTLVRALSRLHLFEPGTNLKAWLLTILRNTVINNIRRDKNRPTDGDDDLIYVPAMTSSADKHIEVQDTADALERLPETYREVILLIGLQGMSYEEASQVTGVNIGTVKSRLSRARLALKDLVDGVESKRHAPPAASPCSDQDRRRRTSAIRPSMLSIIGTL